MTGPRRASAHASALPMHRDAHLHQEMRMHGLMEMSEVLTTESNIWIEASVVEQPCLSQERGQVACQ